MRSIKDYIKERLVPTENEVEMFLYLLRTSLWGSVADDRQVPDIGRVRMAALWQLAKEQTVEGLIAESLHKLYADNPEASMPDFTKLGMNMVYQHQRLNDTIVTLFRHLSEMGIFPVLLKGQGNAARYPNPYLRQCGDIDIYIGEKDFDRACRDVAELVGEVAVEKAELSEKHLHFTYDRLPIEYHRIAERLTNPIVNRRFQVLTHYWLTPERCDKVLINNHPISVPGLQFNALYVFNHTWHHFISGGIGLRQICDWCLILHEAAGKIDIAQLETDLRQLHLLKPWQIFAHIAVEKLGLRPEEMPLYSPLYHEQTEKVWQIVLKGGNFGRYETPRNKASEPYLKRKFKSFILHHKNTYRLITISAEHAFCSYINLQYKGIKRVLSDAFGKIL